MNVCLFAAPKWMKLARSSLEDVGYTIVNASEPCDTVVCVNMDHEEAQALQTERGCGLIVLCPHTSPKYSTVKHPPEYKGPLQIVYTVHTQNLKPMGGQCVVDTHSKNVDDCVQRFFGDHNHVSMMLEASTGVRNPLGGIRPHIPQAPRKSSLKRTTRFKFVMQLNRSQSKRKTKEDETLA